MKMIEKEGLKAFDALNGGQWPNAVVPYAYSPYFSKFMITVSLTVLTFIAFLFFFLRCGFCRSPEAGLRTHSL